MTGGRGAFVRKFPPGDGHVGELGQREQPERKGHDRYAFEQVEGPERPSFNGGIRFLAGGCDHQPDAGCRESLEGIATAEYADERESKDTKGQ